MIIPPTAGELQKLGMHYRTDKAYRHFYMDIYEQFLADRRQEIRNVLEIGVMGGASLRTWRDYFPKATIVGIDRNPKCAKEAGVRIEIRIGDATQLPVLDQFQDDHFDMIVDDGSHLPIDQIMSLCYLWPKLKRNGLYFIEDIGYTHPNWTQWFEVLQPQAFFTHKTPWSVLLVFDKRKTPRLGKG